MNLNTDPKSVFKTPRKTNARNTCAPRKRSKPTKAEARLADRRQAYDKSCANSRYAAAHQKKPGSLTK